MIKSKLKIIAIIPARGGSKALPKKNILNLAGNPLISWTIEASLNSSYITKTLVSSDDDDILDIARKRGAETLKRPSELSHDTASSASVISHALKALHQMHERFDYIILLQPTSPLRKTQHIDEAFDKMLAKKARALISLCPVDNKILKAFKETKEGYIEGISNNEFPFTRRQDLPETYMSNGAIYIIKTEEFEKTQQLFSDRCISYIMDKASSADIDTKEDLERIEDYIANE